MEFKVGARDGGQSLYNASKLLDYINKLPEDKMYGLLKAKGITIMTKDEVISKNKIENIVTTEIENLNKEEKENLKGTKGQDRYTIKQEYMYKKSSLQLLLNKIKGDDK